MIDYINNSRFCNIITFEDPIEYLFKPKKGVIVQRQLGTDMLSFASGLKHALRQDPNVIMVGEMRDLDTIAATITLAETGHLVFGTLHTTSAAKTINRIVDVFPGAEKDIVRTMLSESIRAVISQTLLPKQPSGRLAAHEIMIGISSIRNLIRENKVAQMYSVIQTGREIGMQTLDQCLQKLVNRGELDAKVARTKAENKELFKVADSDKT